MTRNAVDLLARKAMLLVERLGFCLALAPFLFDYLRTGEWPSSPFGLMLDFAAAGAILAVVLLMGYARRLAERVDSLRKTMNEAIIHDLKNPMTAIMGCLSCVLDDSPEVEEREKLVRLALHSCRAQMTLLETLVDTGRLEHGELVVQRLAMKTHTLLDSCLCDVKGIAAHLGVNLEESCAGPIPEEIHGDPDLLPRTIANLLHNAIKYTPPRGSVSLKLRWEGAGLTFEIKDTGIGIPPDHIERLFGKYYRVEGGDQTTRRGSGLGLYFCRLVVEAHGGRISIKSEVGRGTAITFDIPQPFHGGKKHVTNRQAGLQREIEYAGSGQLVR